ncbi:N-acetylneuraminate synthase [candidate division WOR-1 bacterium RIFOXYC2_FULL_37_10]|uniref:N-acetylneuraminate synthase n=1 Tax=candidate division WOR-1 bacterium RIFOXYB2_FULL_37_13 TaxID=1802579 RepID=A0A1F4SQI4_UNCSA|nr:MAG: N-acetylneuraminate synthase [candidate division WOR-1 bacterium RIFOXYB2_FULL_37_13]OGC34233.1 MAG: N-acetylneuraminate synthase [candidate division WOR-1 bacterium RIFOXYC2_FULL_37_10]
MRNHKIKIGNHCIGDGQPCFIIAEIGSNHNRSLKTAKRLIDEAAKAGVDAVKFQIYSAEKLYSKNVPKHSHYKNNLWEMIKEIETPRIWIPELKKYCDKKRIIFFATPFDQKAVDELEPYVDLYKISSFELVDLPLIKYIAKKKKPMIISTGLATMEEINEAYLECLNVRNHNIVFLQCVSAYPASPESINLSAMQTIKHAFNVIVGLSDHTLGFHVPVAAVAMGAKIIEKHFTLDKGMKGPDHPFAIEPKELKEMVSQIRDIEMAMGNGHKSGPRTHELENFCIGRRSIHAKMKIPKGSKIDENMLIIKRPGFGIKPKYLQSVISKKAKRQIDPDAWITWKMIEK